MDAQMTDWLDELDETKNPATAYEEALRFLDVAARGGRGSYASAANHAAWKARDGFSVVMAKAIALRDAGVAS